MAKPAAFAMPVTTASDDGSQAERAPLLPLAGTVPPAPAWFEAALRIEPECSFADIAGTSVEILSWGRRDKPGLLLLHGSAAHAGLWRFMAPQLARDRRVVAFSWPGMGRSDWRASYDFESYMHDMLNVAEVTGLFRDGARPTVIAHSVAGGPAALAAHHHGHRFDGVIIADSAFRAPAVDHRVFGEVRPHRVYSTLEQALAHFRFAPTQPCTKLYIADLIARESLKEVPGGWTWRFDPALWRQLRLSMAWDALGAPRCRLALITGEHSQSTAGLLPAMLAHVPAGTPHLEVPGAHHHLMVDEPLAFLDAINSVLDGWASIRAKPLVSEAANGRLADNLREGDRH